MMTLYGYWRSSSSYRVRIALNMKGADYRYVPVNLLKGEHKNKDYLTRNPQGYVPVLELEDGTCLTQSLAIIDFLDTRYKSAQFMPGDAILRSKVLSASLTIAADISPIQNSSVLNYIKIKHSQDQEGVASWTRHWISKGFDALERIAANRDTNFLYSNQPGFFEICLVPQVYNARRFDLDMSAFPALCEIDEACRTLPAFEKAIPKNQIDAPKS